MASAGGGEAADFPSRVLPPALSPTRHAARDRQYLFFRLLHLSSALQS